MVSTASQAPDHHGSLVAAVDLDLAPEHELIRETVRTFARERIAPVAEELDRESRFPYQLVADLGQRYDDDVLIKRDNQHCERQERESHCAAGPVVSRG